MSSLTLAELRAGYTLEQATTDLVAQLDGAGFAASSWQSGSILRTLVQTSAYVYYVMRQHSAALSRIVFLDDSSGAALTELASSHYGTTRLPSVAAQHACILTGGLIGPPHTLAIGAVVATDGTRTFRNTTTGTVPAGGTLAVTFEAEVPGTDGNVSAGTITALQTVLAGTTITNTSITRSGEDEELDTPLKLRCSARWATLSIVEAIDDRYEYIARNVVPNCRVLVDSSNPDGANTLRVYLAASNGVAIGSEVTDVQTAVDAEHFGGNCTVVAATAQAIPITGTVYYAAGAVFATVQTAVEAAVSAFIDAAPIGGYDYTPGPAQVIDRDGLIDAIRSVGSVRKVTLSVPSGDTSITSFHVATRGTLTISYVEVTA